MEASLILPIILIILFVIIAFSIYINDVVSTNLVVSEYEVIYNKDIKNIKDISSKFSEQLNNSLMLGKVTNYTFSNSKKEISFEIKFSLPFIKKILDYKNKVHFVNSSKRIDMIKSKVLFDQSEDK